MTIPKRVAVTEVSHWHSVNDASYLHILRDLGCDIVGVSDRSARIAGERAEHFGGIPFTDYRQMIEATKPEFVGTRLSPLPGLRPMRLMISSFSSIWMPRIVGRKYPAALRSTSRSSKIGGGIATSSRQWPLRMYGPHRSG